MISHANERMAENRNPDREPYHILYENRLSFAQETVRMGKGHISIFSYGPVTFGLALYGYFYDSSEPALNNLIFTWLLYVWVAGLPVSFFATRVWTWSKSATP
jgi:hypothetical protein